MSGASAAEVSEQRSAGAIQKVIQMMNDMMAKEKQDAIAEGTNMVEKLQADIGDANADAAQMAKDIGGLDADISKWESDRSEANTLRKKAHEQYEKAHAEYDDSIDSVERAIETIKAGPDAALAQTSLLEVSSKSLISAKTRNILTSLLQKWDSHAALLQDGVAFLSEDSSAPEAHAFESQSGGVLAMVEDLGEKFESEKNEMNEKSANDVMVADLTDQIEGATKERNKKT